LVGDAALAAVSAIGITVPGTSPPVVVPAVKRKTPSVPEGSAPALPQFVVSVGGEGRTEYIGATQKLKTYPVAVTIVTATGQRMGDDNTVRLWREQIELALEQRGNWTGLAGWNRATIVNNAPFETVALSKDFNYSIVAVEIEMVEARG
jgi:hypothetical protein